MKADDDMMWRIEDKTNSDYKGIINNNVNVKKVRKWNALALCILWLKSWVDWFHWYCNHVLTDTDIDSRGESSYQDSVHYDWLMSDCFTRVALLFPRTIHYSLLSLSPVLRYQISTNIQHSLLQSSWINVDSLSTILACIRYQQCDTSPAILSLNCCLSMLSSVSVTWPR